MKTKQILSAVFFTMTFCYACEKDKSVNPSENITTREYDFSGYNQLDVEDAFQVEVNFSSDEERILVEANDNLHEHIILEKNLMKLTIRLDDNVKLEGNPATLKVSITTDYIYDFRASGASGITVQDTFGAAVMEINISGASTFGGKVDGSDVNALVTGASTINLEGTCGKFNLDASGASKMAGFDFTMDWLHATLSGASEASVTVNNKLDVWASGASTVYYKGDGVVNTQELTGASMIIKVE